MEAYSEEDGKISWMTNAYAGKKKKRKKGESMASFNANMIMILILHEIQVHAHLFLFFFESLNFNTLLNCGVVMNINRGM